MNGRYDGFEKFGSGDIMKMMSMEAQISSAKQLHDIEATIDAQNEEREFAAKERERSELLRNAERDRVEALRHRENRRLALIAIGIAAISLLVAILK
ncbi:MAG: hypothetical protein CL676_03485 [Bdellovibrionaceae bacterium]|nr:hypothetical protein [Pseudobdellovibrionaceae bacterium]|tara:strand:+ start:11441 stop:11731 length:291 start_codon:yes stop_codon:yes gene_type:complete